eukprot:XP_011445826.1 PREDICTED: uncharacterized protein LOC105341162 [Crassostrea gigas]
MALRPWTLRFQNCLLFSQKWIYRSVRSLSEHTKNIRYEIRPLKRADLPSLHALLAENKWYMEMSYLECVFNTDPSGLTVVVKDNGELIGHSGLLAHGDTIVGGGLTIIKDGYRHLGIGKHLFQEQMKAKGDRNGFGNILTNRITFYAPFGLTIMSHIFHFNQGPVDPEFIADVPEGDFEVVSARDMKFDDVIAYDSEIHTVPRPVYISNWAMHQLANTYVALKSGRVVGYGVVRPSDVGYKMHPLYADDPKIAKALFCRLASHIPTGQVMNFAQPIGNEQANAFVVGNKLTSYISMTRVYDKWNIPVDIQRVYSVSTTEFCII